MLKIIRSSLCLLVVTVLIFSACGRKSNSSTTPDVGISDTETSDTILSPATSGSPNYDPNAAHGKKEMYGDSFNSGDSYARRSPLNTWGNYYFQYGYAWLLCYDQKEGSTPVRACFDPLCGHKVDTCPAFYQFDWYTHPDGAEIQYPSYIFCDYYDNADSPVFYSVYRRSDVGHIGTENFDRDPCYLIQRYDLASGERVTLLSDIQNLIHSAYTYGDYIYYTMSEDYLATQEDSSASTFSLCMLPKSGGEPIILYNDETKSLDILDITDDGVYYLVNGRELYRCSPTLEEPELIIDIDSIKDASGNNTRLAALRNGQLFYFGNLSLIDSEYFSDLYSGDCYRLPLDDLSAEPVKLAENMICETNWVAFTENYLYYQPTVMESANGGLYPVNYSDGVVKAVNLFTGETVTACENTGISFFTGYVVDGDSITVYGQAYENRGTELAGNSFNHIRIYPDGTPYELWFNVTTRDNGFAI